MSNTTQFVTDRESFGSACQWIVNLLTPFALPVDDLDRYAQKTGVSMAKLRKAKRRLVQTKTITYVRDDGKWWVGVGNPADWQFGTVEKIPAYDPDFSGFTLQTDKERFSKVITLPITATQYQHVKDLAAQSGQSIAAFVRGLIPKGEL